MRRKYVKTYLGVLVITPTLLFAFGSCKQSLGPSGDADNPDVDNDDGSDVAYTQGAEILPLSELDGTIRFSTMPFDLIETGSRPNIDVDTVVAGNVSTSTIRFTGARPFPEAINTRVNGTVVVVQTSNAGEEIRTVTNGKLTIDGHPKFTNIVLRDATWIMPYEGTDRPHQIEMSGTIVLNTVEYQMIDFLRAVQAAWTVDGLVHRTILRFLTDGSTPDGMEIDGAGPYAVTFDSLAPSDGSIFTISGTVDVTVVAGTLGTAPLSILLDGGVTAQEFVFDAVDLDSVSMSWAGDSELGEPPDDVSGKVTFDGFEYDAVYLNDIIAFIGRFRDAGSTGW